MAEPGTGDREWERGMSLEWAEDRFNTCPGDRCRLEDAQPLLHGDLAVAQAERELDAARTHRHLVAPVPDPMLDERRRYSDRHVAASIDLLRRREEADGDGTFSGSRRRDEARRRHAQDGSDRLRLVGGKWRRRQHDPGRIAAADAVGEIGVD